MRQERILREGGGNSLVVVERGFFRAVDRQREPLTEVVDVVDVLLGEWRGRLRLAFSQAIDDVRERPNGLGVIERVEESGRQLGVAQMEGEGVPSTGLLTVTVRGVSAARSSRSRRDSSRSGYSSLHSASCAHAASIVSTAAMKPAGVSS